MGEGCSMTAVAQSRAFPDIRAMRYATLDCSVGKDDAWRSKMREVMWAVDIRVEWQGYTDTLYNGRQVCGQWAVRGWYRAE